MVLDVFDYLYITTNVTAIIYKHNRSSNYSGRRICRVIVYIYI